VQSWWRGEMGCNRVEQTLPTYSTYHCQPIETCVHYGAISVRRSACAHLEDQHVQVEFGSAIQGRPSDGEVMAAWRRRSPQTAQFVGGRGGGEAKPVALRSCGDL